MKNNIELKNASCLDYLKTISDNSIDLVLIDPPYEISRPTNFKNGKPSGKNTDRFRITMDFGEWDNYTTDMLSVITECHRVLRNGGTFICFYDIWKITELQHWLEKKKFKQLRIIIWEKTNPVPINSRINYLTNAREIAVSAVKGGKPTFNSKYDNGVYKYPICHDKNRFHPTQKPLELIKKLILKHSHAGDVVLDCFSGSGTTAVACLETGRLFRGCEIDKDFYDKSILRLNEWQ